MLRRLKENKKKGFTLVELIVVLVILAILAALLVPALTGYIDKAKQKSIIAETRQVVMAAQTLGDEVYGRKDVGENITAGSTGSVDVTFADIAELAEVDANKIDTVTYGLTTAGAGGTSSTTKAAVVTKVVYKNNGKTCTYEPANNKADGNNNGDYDVK